MSTTTPRIPAAPVAAKSWVPRHLHVVMTPVAPARRHKPQATASTPTTTRNCPMLTAKALMVALVLAPLSETQRCAPRLVLDPAAVAAFRVPNGDIRTTITINVAGRTVTADLASKSIRKGAATIGEHGADAR